MQKASDKETILNLLFRGFYSTAYQPIVTTDKFEQYGFESLLRGPEDTPLATPEKLFGSDGPLKGGDLLKLDRACIESAVRTGRNLPDGSRLFINILGETFRDLVQNLDDFLLLLEELNVDPKRLVFEISENTTKACTENLVKCVEAVRRAGIGVALDDIGVRSPYIYQLLYLEPEFLKVDRIFIQDIDNNKRKQDLVAGMAYMATKMGATIIAEGVETIEESKVLAQMNVPLSQGYYHGRAMPAENWITENKNSDVGIIRRIK